ncbi:hypothetical protein A9Q83_10185 [Alphaproteobacteria bacterium 46_93_T64]|nr:hypothetical protein A9Q83_10185 [Alphaproteobacteria bacterium 46_93_T64]
MNVEDIKLEPLIVTVAPNGARKTKKDHDRLPITPEELAVEAHTCMMAGASMIHLHVRGDKDEHSLDVGRYREAMAAINDKCGDALLIQATTEAVGMYSAYQQMAMVRDLVPPSASLAIRELVPDGGERAATAFFHELAELEILPHYILYSDEDVKRFNDLRKRGVIPDTKAFLLFVLGRYTENQTSHPRDILPFLRATDNRDAWSVCAFGPLEHAAASAAIALGGHVRVGFENNMFLKDGSLARSNADLITQISQVSAVVGRPVGGATDIKNIVI